MACCLGSLLLAPRGVTVVVLSDAKRSLVVRVDVQGDSSVSEPIEPCSSAGVVVCPRGESSIVVTVDDGRVTATHDLDLYVEARTVAGGSVEVSQEEDGGPLVFRDVRFRERSVIWGLLPQGLFARGVVLGLAIGLLLTSVRGGKRRRVDGRHLD